MDEKEAEARPVMGTIFLVLAVCLVLILNKLQVLEKWFPLRFYEVHTTSTAYEKDTTCIK